MRVKVVHCGPFANESERKAAEHLKHRLQSEPGDDEWILLTNLAFSVTHRLQSDEIDIVAIGPPGVRVIEVKHWTSEWARDRPLDVEREADLVTGKARKVGTSLRRHLSELPHVAGAFLLTQDASKLKRLARETIRGVSFHPLNGWKEAIGLDGQSVLSPIDVRRLSQYLEPRSPVAIDGSLRRLAGYVNLELRSPKEQRFHRVYRGSHPTRRDRVVLHLYDLSAADDKNAGAKARREFEALHRLQFHRWAPRILDSFQEAPGYAGEMFFFTVVDPAAPSLAGRSEDATWTPERRLEFARNAIQALSELHEMQADGQTLVHRNISPETVLVKFDNTPILTGFDRTKIPSDVSVASSGSLDTHDAEWTAPEVRAMGLAAADRRSDIFSLCSSLALLFRGASDKANRQALTILEGGMHADPDRRSRLEDLHAALSRVLGISMPRPETPPARFWTEGQTVSFHDRDYRLVNRLGTGGVGTTFKVVELDRGTKEDLGTYVAKVAHEGEVGTRILKSYSLARSHLGRHAGLSTIFEVAREWQENKFVALMTWVDGSPLAEFTGVFPLLAEDLQEPTPAHLAVRWLRSVCESLGVLHRNGLIHGDVSPRNLIVSGGDLVLTDYDFVTRIGDNPAGPGTVLYSPPSNGPRTASPSDDIYALGASLFHVLYGREPFQHGGDLEKQRGINWDGLDRTESVGLGEFFERATHPEPERRFQSVTDAIECLGRSDRSPGGWEAREPLPGDPNGGNDLPTQSVDLREERVAWVRNLLQAYPGSRWGNKETRGLDSQFSESTYVETRLEGALLQEIRDRKTRLVILCGNAGDGKTALLQHLARQLGLGKHPSSHRILEGRLADGLRVRMNLDGSAAWRGRSADELLDEFLGPFQDGEPADDIAHLLAINDGRLLEWVEGYPERNGGHATELTDLLAQHLEGEPEAPNPHVRFISLNQRSLVGDVTTDPPAITTDFLDRLVDHLYGGEQARVLWSPCVSCSAKTRCEIYRAARRFGPDTIPFADEAALRRRARERLFEALQAVHLRGEMHITVRELRAALVYILFGLQFCDDYHAAAEETPSPYWDRAFEASSTARQGELLPELARFDPAWDAHPQIDRHLSTRPVDDGPTTAPRYPEIPLESARRRAYFEWTSGDISEVGGDQDTFGLARGRHLREFRLLPLSDSKARTDLCRRICGGISRLEDLPPKAVDRPGVVPLRVTPRTPTETAFWVEKPLTAFRLEPDLPGNAEGIERLHRQAVLIYRYRDGQEECLYLGAELFDLLLELNDGYQLGDISSDDTFANLSIFVQRLVQEDARELFAWNPMADELIYRIAAEYRDSDRGRRQYLALSPLTSGDGR